MLDQDKEMSDNSLELELQSIEKKLIKLKQQERDIIQMKLDGRISDDLYDEKLYPQATDTKNRSGG